MEKKRIKIKKKRENLVRLRITPIDFTKYNLAIKRLEEEVRKWRL